MNVQEACEKALMEHWRRLERRGYKNRGISVIAMDHQGNTGAATNFLFAPDEEWLKNSKLD